jgi:hypothetical protein
MRSSNITLLVSAAIVAGCASTPRPTEELTRARTLIDQAAQSGAQQYAADNLQEARDRAAAADAAASKHDNVAAQRLANEASADAQLAAARAESGKAQQSVRELNDSLNSLREESTRKNEAGVPPAVAPSSTVPPPPPAAPQSTTPPTAATQGSSPPQT